MMPASTAAEIFAAQEAFAPSQIMPETDRQRVDQRMRHLAQPATVQVGDARARQAQPALTAPQ